VYDPVTNPLNIHATDARQEYNNLASSIYFDSSCAKYDEIQDVNISPKGVGLFFFALLVSEIDQRFSGR
jgi:hypothetical protein